MAAGYKSGKRVLTPGAQVLGLITRILRVAKRSCIAIIHHAYAIAQAPSDLLDPNKSTRTRVHEFIADSFAYHAISVDKARIFTNRRDIIAVMQGKNLVPHVSLQHHGGKLLSDAENFVLTRRVQLRNPPVHFSGTVLSLLTGEPANYNFYHWFFDCLPRLVIAASLAEQESELRYLIPDDAKSFQRESLDHLGITSERRISSADISFLSADRIIATSPSNPQPEEFPRWILNFVRESFLPLATVADQPSLIYISRNDSSNSRRLLNETDLWQPLRQLGFARIELSAFSLSEQISIFSNAEMIVSVHGAGLTNLAFAKQGALVYELFAESFQPQMYKRMSDMLHLLYQPVVCSTTDHVPQLANLTISDSAIDKIIDAGRTAVAKAASSC